MSSEQPWNDERVIAEAETIAASYVLLDDDNRRILRSEIIGVLRRSALAEGMHYESRAEAAQRRIQQLESELATLRQELAEKINDEIWAHECKYADSKHNRGRARYKELTGRDYEEGEGESNE